MQQWFVQSPTWEEIIGNCSASEICPFLSHCHQISLGSQDSMPVGGKNRREEKGEEEKGDERREKMS